MPVHNKYFATLAQDKIAANTKNGNAVFINNNPLHFLFSAFNQTFPSLKLKFVSSKEIEDITDSSQSKDSHRYDELSIYILKASSLYVSSPLTYLCNLMLSSGIFPSTLKFSEIKPLFKKGDKSSISNYRPISVLTSFSKTIEKIICTRLTEHLNYNRILAEEQFAFRNKSSTASATYKLLNDIHH
jgi:Notch-like protein